MTVLMITPYPPYRDGIATYAVQEVKAMRAAGVAVEVMSPVPSAAHHHLVIGSATGMTRLLGRIGEFERVIIQFYPELLFGACRARPERHLVWSLLEVLARRVPTELRIHELDYGDATIDRAMRTAARRALLAADRLTVHTAAERDRLVETLDLAPEAIDLIDHGAAFVAKSRTSQPEARAELGIPLDAHVFLSIGFIQRHKGFDRAIRAFQRAQLATGGERQARLYIVGSTRVEHPDLVSYADELDRLAAATEGVEFRHGYVGDEEFDRWLVAADTLVLPYREIWSSGVVERARLFNVAMITTAVGGLADQVPAGSITVDTDDELMAALANRAGVAVSASPQADTLDQEALQHLMRQRAGSANAEMAEADDVVAAVARVGKIGPATPTSARPMVSQIKVLIQRLTGWQLLPVMDQLNSLQGATVAALEELRSEIAAGRHLDKTRNGEVSER